MEREAWLKISVQRGSMNIQANVSNEIAIALMEGAKATLIQRMMSQPAVEPSKDEVPIATTVRAPGLLPRVVGS